MNVLAHCTHLKLINIFKEKKSIFHTVLLPFNLLVNEQQRERH